MNGQPRLGRRPKLTAPHDFSVFRHLITDQLSNVLTGDTGYRNSKKRFTPFEAQPLAVEYAHMIDTIDDVEALFRYQQNLTRLADFQQQTLIRFKQNNIKELALETMLLSKHIFGQQRGGIVARVKADFVVSWNTIAPVGTARIGPVAAPAVAAPAVAAQDPAVNQLEEGINAVNLEG